MKPSDIYRSTAWKYFSRYVLLTYSDGLITQCSTCGKMLQINQANCHAGHLIKVTDSYATVFDENNILPQCSGCNTYRGGRQDVMYRKILTIHGQKAIDMLYIRKNNICHLDRFTLDILAKEYKAKFDQLAKEKGNPWKK